MAIRFKCGKCGKGIKVPDGTAGKPTVCGGCGHQQVIPAPAPEAPAPDAPKETAAATPPKPEPPAPPKDPAEESWAINLSQEEPGEPTDALAALAGATRAEDDAAPAAAGQPEKEVPLAVDAEAESAAAPEGDEAVAAEQEGSKKRHKAIPMFTCAYCGQFFRSGQVIDEDDRSFCKDCYVAAGTAASAPAA